VFIVRWEGGGPGDKAEWITVLREALSGEPGSYRVCFRRARKGWRFVLDCRPESVPAAEAVIANSPESVAFNIQQLLLDKGKPLDPDWSP
jgi:hypothetical protein